MFRIHLMMAFTLAVILYGGISNADTALTPYLDRGYAIAPDQSGARVIVFDAKKASTSSQPTEIVWEWNARDGQSCIPSDMQGRFNQVDEAKLRDGGTTLLVSSSGTAWAEIDVATKKARRCGTSGGNTHSIEKLPDNTLVLAHSTGTSGGNNKLQLVWGEMGALQTKDVYSIYSAHGVEWDEKRGCLWALGYTNLVQLAYNPTAKTLTKQKQWTFTPSGHDMRLGADGRIYFTNWYYVWEFDPDHDQAPKILFGKTDVKGFHTDPTYGYIYQVASSNYWNNHIIVRSATGEEYKVYPQNATMMYKVHWATSYPASIAALPREVTIAAGETVEASIFAANEFIKDGRGTLVTTGDFKGKAALKVGTWRIANGSKVVVEGSPISETTWFYVKGEQNSLDNPIGGAFLEVTEGSSLTVKGVSYVGIGDRFISSVNRTRGYGSIVVKDGSYLELAPSSQVRVTDYGSVGGYGVLAISNSTATVRKEMRLAPTARNDNYARLSVSHSTLTNAEISVRGPATNGAWFDAATLVPLAASTNWLNSGSRESRFHIEKGGLVIDTAFAVTIPESGVLSGDGGLIKQGRGTLTLDADNSYSGDTIVREGTLIVGSSLMGRAVMDGGNLTLGGAYLPELVVSQPGTLIIASPGATIARATGYRDSLRVNVPGLARLTAGTSLVRSNDADFLAELKRMLIARIAADLDLEIANGTLRLVHNQHAGTFVGGIVSRVALVDGKNTWTNPGCGFAGGGWSTLSKDVPTPVTLKSPNQTKLWSLQNFSKGYYYKDAQHYEKAMQYCGGADIPLNEVALKSIEDAFASCRAAGGTVIPRFAYTWDGWGGCEPDNFEMVLTHIRQLAAICSRYRDIIPAVECGTIGAYGEMHTSRYCERDYARRITSAWLDNLPEDMALLVRSPCYILYEAQAATTTEFFGRGLDMNSRIRRIGFYNDGYLGTDGDYGTWGSGSTIFTRSQGRDYLRKRGNLPYGGEFATVTDKFFDENVHLLDIQRFNLVAEWYDTHLSFLRTIHSTEMTVYKRLAATIFDSKVWAFDGMPYLAEYDGEDFQKFCEDHMGFRFVVRGVEAKRKGREVTLALKIENTGFGRLCFPETKEILIGESGGKTLRSLSAKGTDLRLLEGGRMTAVEISFALPESIPYGRYEIALRERVPLSDEDGTQLPRRAIAFANEGAYDAETKANYLGTIHIDGSFDDATSEDVSSGGEVLVVAGTTRDLTQTVFTPDSRLVLAGGGTLILGESVPAAIEIDNGRLEFSVYPDGFDFGSLVTHGNEVIIRNDGAMRVIELGNGALDDYTLVGNFRYMVPAGRTITLNTPTWLSDFGVDVYGTLDVRADLTLAGKVEVLIHDGGTMGNLGRSATNSPGKIIVLDRARIVVGEGGRLLNPVNGNWSGSGLELMTSVKGATSLVLAGGTVAVHRMSGSGLGKIEVTKDSFWDVWYGEWYGNGRTPDPFKGAAEVRIAAGATLTMERIRQTFGNDQQDGASAITINLANVHITGEGNLVFTNTYSARKVEFVIISSNECSGEVSIVEDTGTTLVFLTGSTWEGSIVVTPGVKLPDPWWFSYNATNDSISGGSWLSEDVFEVSTASDCNYDASFSFTGVVGWMADLPDIEGGGASFLFLDERGSLVPYGRTAEGWTRLGGKTFVEGTTFELEIDFKRRFGKWTVGFAVDRVSLCDDQGRTRFPAKYEPETLRRIVFEGPARRGDFRGKLVRRPQGFLFEIR